MLQHNVNAISEREGRKKLAAVQTKSQKRWRARGVQLTAILSEYSKRSNGELDLIGQDEELFLDSLYL